MSTRARSTFRDALGPGLLYAGAAVGVSHLVQSTRAGAEYGLALWWAIVLAVVVKYPFLEMAPRYAAATGESLIDGYRRLGRGWVGVYVAVTVSTMFAIQAAVTIVTAGIAGGFASSVLGIDWPVVAWAALVVAACSALLLIGRYALLDRTMKVVIVALSASTVVAAVVATARAPEAVPPPSVWTAGGVWFLLALMGWMPTPLDVAAWHSLWTLGRQRQTRHRPSVREATLDFEIGYWGAGALALFFLLLGSAVMYGSGIGFPDAAPAFAAQLVEMYGRSLGRWAVPLISVAVFTAMFSTTLTVTDAYPRVLGRLTEMARGEDAGAGDRPLVYGGWLALVAGGALVVIAGFASSLTALVDVATVLSFLTAPVLAWMNLRLITSEHTPAAARPPRWLVAMAWGCLVALVAFDLLYVWWRWLGPTA